MIKVVLSLLAAGIVAVFPASTSLAQQKSAAAGNAAAAAAPEADSPHRVGLIDMGEVFQAYKKFEDLRNDFNAELTRSDAEAKSMYDDLQKLQTEINDKKFAPGSPQFEQAEKLLLEKKGEFDAFRAATQRKLGRRETEMFKQIYTDTAAVVSLYAQHKKFTVVMRFDRKDIDENTPAAEAVARMNKQVVYYRSSEDITDPVLNYLNKQYAQTAPTATPGKAQPPVRGVSATSGDGKARQ